MMVDELNTEAKALVLEGRLALRPSLQDKERVAGALRARLSSDGSTLSSAPAESVAGALLSKPVLGGLLLIIAVGTAAYLLRSVRADVATTTAVETTSSIQYGQQTQLSLAHAESPSSLRANEDTAVARVANTRSQSTPSKDQLGAEAALLMRAEKAYHAGQLNQALASVDEHARKFPAGLLEPERTRLRQHVVCGMTDSAKTTQGQPIGDRRKTGERVTLAQCER